MHITVIIPTYNRALILAECLKALAAQQLAAAERFEVIVIDDGSADDTAQVVGSFINSHPKIFSSYSQANSGANAARNRGIRYAKGELLLFINDDTIAIPTMLAEHLRLHQRYRADNVAVLGKVTISPKVPYSAFSKVHLDCMYSRWEGMFELPWVAFYTCNISVKKAFLEQYGLFEESLRYHEDVELGERLSHHGLRIFYQPTALGYHLHFQGERDYLNVAQKEGIALARWFRKAPHLVKELSRIDCHLAPSPRKRVKYLLADLAINALTLSTWIMLARILQGYNEPMALTLYQKIYQAIKRRHIRMELNTNSPVRSLS